PLTIAVTLSPTVGSDATKEVVKVKVVVDAPKGTYGVHLRGGKRRDYVSQRDANTFDDLLALLNGSEDPDQLIVSGGASGVFTQDVIVHGKDSFKIEVV
ncbi:MAG TPA: hypothetical protein VE976_01330, partial [Actinomycetota bacterium]|nr:hypothetical protein [Actinomycetota bacterium]